MAPPRRGDLSPEEKDLLGVIATGEPGPALAPRRRWAVVPPRRAWPRRLHLLVAAWRGCRRRPSGRRLQRCALTRRRGPGRVAAPAGLLEPGRPSLPPQHRPRRLYPGRLCFHSRRWRPKWRRAKGRPRPLGWGAGAVTGRAAASRGPRAPLGPRLRAGRGRAGLLGSPFPGAVLRARLSSSPWAPSPFSLTGANGGCPGRASALVSHWPSVGQARVSQGAQRGLAAGQAGAGAPCWMDSSGWGSPTASV